MIKEIYEKRDLVYELVLKNLKLRYSQPLLGSFWSFLSPLLMVGIFYLVFAVFLKVRIEETPFVLYLMSAIFPWRFFQESLMESTTSLLDNKNLIRESPFPHYLIPVSTVLANAVNLLPSLIILLCTSSFILKGLPVSIIMLPVILAIHFSLTMGLSITLSVLYIRWRDIKYLLEAVLLLLFYMTPVFYSINVVKDSFSLLFFRAYMYNPLVGILNLYRLSILKGFYRPLQEFSGPTGLFIIPAGFAVAALLLGFYTYRRNRETINDYLSY